MLLRPARLDEADQLSHIAFTAKAHWGYEDELLKSWKPELTYSAEYIDSHWVTVAEDTSASSQGKLLGVCALDPFGDQLEIAGLWVLPNAMGQGVGRQLLRAALSYCRSQRVAVLRLLSDPNAQGFYKAMGAELIGYERGSPKGRLLPLMHMDSGLNKD